MADEKQEHKIIPAAESAVPATDTPILRELIEEGRRANMVKSAAPTGMTPFDMDGIIDQAIVSGGDTTENE